MPRNSAISDDYRSSIQCGLSFSLAAAIISMLMLDFGESARATGGGLLVFWTCALLALLRRPGRPTRFDLFLIRWGCLPFVFVFNVLLQWYWRT